MISNWAKMASNASMGNIRSGSSLAMEKIEENVLEKHPG